MNDDEIAQRLDAVMDLLRQSLSNWVTTRGYNLTYNYNSTPSETMTTSQMPLYEDKDEPPNDGFTAQSVTEKVQAARERLEQEVFFSQPLELHPQYWAEEAAGYVARFYGQPLDRVHVELFREPLARYQDAVAADAQQRLVAKVRNLSFNSEDPANLKMLLDLRDQIAGILDAD